MLEGAFVNSVCAWVGLPRYWYGLPPWPAGQYAWRRQLESPSNSSVRQVAQSIEKLNPAYYVELRAYAIAAEQIRALAYHGPHPTHKSIFARIWPTTTPDVQPPPRAMQSIDVIA